MTSAVSLASQALTLIRANAITSFTDGSNEADVVNIMYADFVKDILGRYPWSFAKKKISLTVDTTSPVNEWRYSHQMPTDCLRLIAIYASSAIGTKPVKDWERHGNYIHSDYATLWGEYIFDPGEAYWPGYFTQYAIYALAALIAMPVTDDPDLAAQMKRLAYGLDEDNERGGKFGVAASTDAQSTPPEEVGMPDLILARFC
jgi:hypothetical protein